MIADYQRDNYILAKPENFKGITYVRLSALPAEQATEIRESHYRDYIIKILNGHSLMNDCMIYTDYVKWHQQHNSLSNASQQKEETTQLQPVLTT